MEKFNIFVGNKIYEWEILGIDKTTCKCKCSCGEIKNVNINNLARGLSKSCGHTRRNDLTGKQFGEWKVIKYTETKNRKTFYLCECSCGKQKEIRSYDLVHNITKSCGHNREYTRNSIINKKFGELTVIKIIDSNKALCKCSCGVEKEVNIYSLKSGSSKSCGHTTNRGMLTPGDKIDDLILIDRYSNGIWKCKCKCGAELNVNTYELNKYRHLCRGKHKVAFRDLHGQQFGEWKVLKYKGKSMWECKCSCGTVKDVQAYTLLSGGSLHCNSDKHPKNNIIDITDKKFGKLTVIEYNKPYWKCQCECGHTVNVLSHNLRNGSTTSCGCSRILFSKEDIINTISKFEYKPFIYELAETLDVHEATIRDYIAKYALYNYIDKSYRSRFEHEIAKYIESNGYTVITSDRTVIAPLELDIYIPDKKLAIEFNGNYWHSELCKDVNYHQNKTIACAKKGIQLIHIFEYEWNDNNKKIKGIIDSKLGINIRKEFARNTIIKEVSTQETKQFLVDNHIQGYSLSSINIGCYKNNEIIGIMTFGKPRFNDRYQYEIIRFCWKIGSNVIGGAEKLFKYFLRIYNPESIITYCDISKFTGNVYTRLGFTPLSNPITKPNYVWYNDYKKLVLSRYKTQKAELINLGLDKYGDTEDEIMHTIGYCKIYNSGNIVLEWRQ